MPMRKLYFVTADDEDGENFDLLLMALSLEEAWTIWRTQYEFDESWAGPMRSGCPVGKDSTARFYEVETNPGHSGPLAWSADYLIPSPHFPAGRVVLVGHIEWV